MPSIIREDGKDLPLAEVVCYVMTGEDDITVPPHLSCFADQLHASSLAGTWAKRRQWTRSTVA